ncbi:g kinase-anchoring protein 1-B [Trichonephila clavata]|uniref:G kinase-anchoring protein 1-B n=1 Tax=Trichonephila clavata TaxID=2740835 RepID=A0A8X6G4U8_TRICU|nr:g kinase-anchoring protein 1-B [Trichonephila clavata]
MAVACASRFAVLKLEDDEVNEVINKASKGSKSLNSGQANKNKSNGKSKKKKKVSSEIAELQNMAFGTINKPKPKSSSNSKGNHANQNSQKQWEEWKAKDSEFVSETYEQDLQEALLLSKIDYEEKKDVYDALQKEAEQNKLGANKKRKKNNLKKDKGTMSLDEFQNLGSENDVGNVQKGNSDDSDVPQKPLEDTNFFDKIEEDVEKIITKEQRQEQFKSYNSDQEAPRFLQFQEELRKKDDEIALLNGKVNKLKEELKNVKSRNKKLYGILESGEMREKAEILLQIDQLISVKDELTEQVSEYHTALEQERSKVHALQSELKKYQQNNKKQRTESK